MNESTGATADPAAPVPVHDDARQSGVPTPPTGSPTVLCVVVCHNGSDFLERTLTALGQSTRHPTRVVAVDVGSDDETAEWLATNPRVVDLVVTMAPDAGFSAAVHEGIDDGGPSDLVWLLHDDSAPDPTALAELTQVLIDQASVGAVGPKVLGWDDPRRVLEVGVSISRSGRRFTGLEAREQDQGQLDVERDVLSVGSAGLLVRRAVWDELGGFDRAIKFHREDIDFGWRLNLAGHRVVVAPQAVVHHAEAATHRRRSVNVSGLPRTDRASAMYVLLANTSRLGLVGRWLWLLLASAVRTLGFLLGKSPHEASTEIAAIGQVLFSPGLLRHGRRARRRHRTVPARSLRSLFPPPGHQLRQSVETAVLTLNLDNGESATSVLESGPADEDIDNFGGPSSGRLRRLVRRPGVLIFTGLLLVMLLAWRGLYRGGVLHGGSLLPIPPGASDVWSNYVASWHPVSAGSPVMSPPSSAVLAVIGTLLMGKATWVVPLALVVGPALAAAIAYVVLSTFGLTTRIRVWGAVAYALNPVLLAAVAQARWGTVLSAVLLPLLGLATARACGLRGWRASGQAAAAAALLMALIVALAPPLWLPLAVLGGLVIWRWAPTHVVRLRLVGVVVAPAAVWLPWLPVVISDPTQLLLDPGVPLGNSDAPPWQVLMLDPGGWASAPLFFGIGLMIAGVAAVVRTVVAPAVRGSLVVAGVGLVWALVLSAIEVTPSSSELPVVPWPGSALLLAVIGLVAAVGLAAKGSLERLQRRDLSWRQPVLAVVTVLAVLTPLLCGVWWLDRGAEGPIDRGAANPLPAFVRAQSALPEQFRTLVLQPSQGRLQYTLLRQRDSQFGDVETAPPADRLVDLNGVVSDLASGRGAAPVARLGEYAVAYVLAVPPVDPELEAALDSAPGVVRIANPGDASLWSIDQPTGRVRVVSKDGQYIVLRSGSVDASVSVPSGDDQRLLTLAELSDPGWSATVDGQQLDKQTEGGWSQAFGLGSSADRVEITHHNQTRTVLLWVELVIVLALLVFALPSRRTKSEELV